jgi:hypothetical protein
MFCDGLRLVQWCEHFRYDDFVWLLLIKVKVTLRLTVGQSVSLGVEPHLGLMTRYLLLFDGYGLVFVGRPLWREIGSVFCICCWSSPAQSFSGLSPFYLATIFYCLSFETSLFVSSYDSQGHGRGIRPRLHTGLLLLLVACSVVLYNLCADYTENFSRSPYCCVSTNYRRGVFTSVSRSNGRVTDHIETVSLLKFVYRAVA